MTSIRYYEQNDAGVTRRLTFFGISSNIPWQYLLKLRKCGHLFPAYLRLAVEMGIARDPTFEKSAAIPRAGD